MSSSLLLLLGSGGLPPKGPLILLGYMAQHFVPSERERHEP